MAAVEIAVGCFCPLFSLQWVWLVPFIVSLWQYSVCRMGLSAVFYWFGEHLLKTETAVTCLTTHGGGPAQSPRTLCSFTLGCLVLCWPLAVCRWCFVPFKWSTAFLAVCVERAWKKGHCKFGPVPYSSCQMATPAGGQGILMKSCFNIFLWIYIRYLLLPIVS